MELLALFDSLEKPGVSDDFLFSATIIPESNGNRIAINKDGAPALLIRKSGKLKYNTGPNVDLRHISVVNNVNCTIKIAGEICEDTFTVLQCKADNMSLRRYFLDLCTLLISKLYLNNENDNLAGEILSFVELFSLAGRKPSKSIQGLWAELFIISQSTDICYLVEAWHCTPEDVSDFNDGIERLEVKSTANNSRIHTFSNEQLTNGTAIASVVLRQTDLGQSILDLRQKIVERLQGELDKVSKVDYIIRQTLGELILEIDSVKYEMSQAIETVLFFDVKNVPHIQEQCIPNLVTNVRIDVNLSLTDPLRKGDLQRFGKLINSSWH